MCPEYILHIFVELAQNWYWNYVQFCILSVFIFAWCHGGKVALIKLSLYEPQCPVAHHSNWTNDLPVQFLSVKYCLQKWIGRRGTCKVLFWRIPGMSHCKNGAITEESKIEGQCWKPKPSVMLAQWLNLEALQALSGQYKGELLL